MKNLVLYVSLGLLSLTLVGCGSKADRLIKKQIKLMNKVADRMENGATEADIKDLTDEMKEIGKQLDELELSEEEKKKLEEKYKDDMKEATERMMKAAFKGAMDKMKKEMGKGGFNKGAPSFGK